MPSRRRRRRDPRPLVDALATWRRRAGAHGDAGPLGVLRQAFEELGEPPQRVMPTRLSRSGVLTVACADAAEAQALAGRADSLRIALGRAVPDVPLRSIRAVVADHALSPPTPARRATPPPAPSDEEIARAERIAEGVADPRLRELIARAAAARIAIERRSGRARGPGVGGAG